MSPLVTSRFVRPSVVIVVVSGLLLVWVSGGPAGAAAGGSDNEHVTYASGSEQPATPAGSLAQAGNQRKPGITYPRVGRQEFKVASGRSKVAGKAGPLLRYRVAVEKDISGITANQFAARVVETLSDRRSWVGTGQVRLQRVPNSADYDFTIYLVTPQTRDELCGDDTAGRPDRYTSCRNGERVVLNVARWVNGVPHYGASLERYRSYMINHETGHRLGHHHQKCPGEGRRAPVMQQQTLGLHGCVANAWPRVRGKLYEGRAGAYDDPIPRA